MRKNTGNDAKTVTPAHKEQVRKEMDKFIAEMNAEYEKDIVHIRYVNSKPRTPNAS